MRFIVPIVVTMLLVFGMVTGLLLYAIIISVVIIFLSVRIVTPNTVKTVELMWKYNRILRPWLNFIIPLLEWTKHQDLFRKNFTANVESISSDNVTVKVRVNILYYVSDNNDDSTNGAIYKSIYTIHNFTQFLESTIDEQLRAMISTFDHKEIYSKRQEIWSHVEINLREKLLDFWYVLDSIQVRDISLDWNVLTAMNKVIAAQKLKEAAINEWDAKKIMQVKQAEADKESKILLGQWMAWQRMEIAKWFKESVDMILSTDSTLTWDKILKFLLDSSRIETLWNIGTTDKTKLVYLNEDLEGRSMDKETKLIAGSELMR